MSKKFPKIYRLIVLLTDLVTVVLGFFAGTYLRNLYLAEEGTAVEYFDFPMLFLYIVIAWWTLLVGFDAFEKRRFWSLEKELKIGVLVTLIGLAFLFTIGFLTKSYYPRSIILSFSICFLFLWAIQKIYGYRISLKIRKQERRFFLT